MKPLFCWGNIVVLLFLDFLKERECVRRLGRMKNRHIYTFPSLHASNSEKPHLLLPSQQRLQKIRFLQKLGCPKPCWEQARLSSLVKKKQVGLWLHLKKDNLTLALLFLVYLHLPIIIILFYFVYLGAIKFEKKLPPIKSENPVCCLPT